ncbi:MAG: protoporphyrinogen oxidase HemJ [Gammaproteobacteria bacterium]|nr:protoporphyrinogen oxidase HemJ [Gammaproteobacteria bacterium]
MDTWLKTWHLITMVSWFAGLFYMPRLFVYHAMSDDETSRERFKLMERKLYNGIMTPAMIATLILGTWMLLDYAWAVYSQMGWLHVKLALITVLVGYHLYCGKLMKTFAAGTNPHSHVWYRWFNEIPVFFLIGIVILAVMKPF